MSAVDAHVGQHIFKHCIKGALRNKTILLATHQLQVKKGYLCPNKVFFMIEILWFALMIGPTMLFASGMLLFELLIGLLVSMFKCIIFFSVVPEPM